MTDHDHHDMARLAELAASDPEGAETRAMVDDCAECAEELRLQIQALSLLGDLPPAKLTETERSRVRQGVWESLQPETETPSPVAEPTPVRSSPPWYTRVVGAAAALVVLAGLGYFLVDNPLLGGDGDSGDVSDQAVATTSAGAEDEADDTADMAAEAAPDTAQSAEGTDETANRDGSEEEATAATTAAEGTVAAAETTAAGEAPEDTLTSDAVTLSQTLDPVVAEAIDRVVDRLRDTAQDRTPQSAEGLDLSRPEMRCLESLDLDEVLAVDSITARDRRLMVVSHQGAETVEVEVIDLADCSQVSTR